MKPLALIKTGGTLPQMIPGRGDFEDWFAHGLGDIAIEQVDVFRGEAPGDPQRFSGVLVTGSVSMVTDREDWSESTADWLRRAIDAGLPTLGVCYGHQLIAHALGGEVGDNPNGRQIGTRPCHLLPEAADDELFENHPEHFPVQTSHLQVVLTPPEGATRLAETPLDPNFVLRFRPNTWGVQYHPEFSVPVMRDYIRLRGAMLQREGLDDQGLLAAVEPTPVANGVLSRFADLVNRDALQRAIA